MLLLDELIGRLFVFIDEQLVCISITEIKVFLKPKQRIRNDWLSCRLQRTIILTFLKSFGQEIKEKTNKREFFCVSIKRGLITHSTNTLKYIKKILKSWSYVLIETEVWNTYCWIMVYIYRKRHVLCFFHSLKYDRYIQYSESQFVWLVSYTFLLFKSDNLVRTVPT